ncbi:glycerol-3-phosphate binding protein [Ligilactobacillus ruminis DSM 20403 = NBRC 102161]|uniref:Glycerol-3-phosphate binding protein n=2 Tax=Ligilactobacillus ruminis TaxID=1623 RepID=A0A837IRM8_9LACO|nr:glycerol-3-phosphate binding protein [Ligilactobacillus ruminis]KRM82044.1 glycerol-3-phosphate binding protein [Ligilactobacillus ruminis DSM 20403 = NBRC 102161]SFG50257.1 sn-glycerol 3-phosphate transport system substrate-binding protein [Ligilactobacillus ruminis DSM 20403 = NBRC 102161]
MKIKRIAVALGAAFSIMAFAANPANVSASERTKIVFWHEMTGPAQVELKRLVNEFNKHQDKYEVEAEFEGDYNEAVQKILNTHGTDASPAVFQAMDISSAQMYYSKHTTPVQKFIDEDGYDVSQISSVARAFYSKDFDAVQLFAARALL